MKSIKTLITSTALSTALLFSGLVPTMADDHTEDKQRIVQTYTFKVDAGHGDAFRDGMKAYWACVKENGGENYWSAWVPVTGPLGEYYYRSQTMNWADMDADSPAGEACGDTFTDQVMPHVASMSSEIETLMPETYIASEGDVKVVRLISFDFDNTSKAYAMIKDMVAGSEASGRQGILWLGHNTGADKWDATVAIMNSDFAGLEPDSVGFWDMQAEHHGEEKAMKMRKDWMANTLDSSSRIVRHAESIGYEAPEE